MKEVTTTWATGRSAFERLLVELYSQGWTLHSYLEHSSYGDSMYHAVLERDKDE